MQVILALCALAIAGLFTYNVKSHTAHTERGMIWNEVEALALSTAQSKLDRAGTLPFDSRGTVTAASAFTDSTAFGGRTYETATDLDDLNGATWADTVGTDEGELLLATTMRVRYVALSGGTYQLSAAKTYTKELTVTVTGPQGARVRLSRVYAYRPN